MFRSAAAAKSLQSCPTLCDPIDGSPPGSPVPGILQARTLEWVAISFSNAYKWKGKMKSLSRVWLFATPWTIAYQAPQSIGFSRQEYWSGVPLPLSVQTICSKSFSNTKYLVCLMKWLILQLGQEIHMRLKGLIVPKSEKVLKKKQKKPVSMTYVKGTQKPNEKKK